MICCDEERTIGPCLESLAFCDEIVVVDSGSEDRTLEIARRYSDRVVVQPFLGYVKQKNFALDLARHDWVVALDADEVLSKPLRDELLASVASAEDSVAGFELDRVTFFLGVWHDRGEWYPDWQLRAFRRSRGRWVGRDPHDRVEVDGVVLRLRGRLEHRNYLDLADHIRTIDRFSATSARAMRDEGVRFRLVDLLFRPLFRFCKGYLVRQGFRKGVPGLLVSISTAYYVFMKYAKLWELERHRG